MAARSKVEQLFDRIIADAVRRGTIGKKAKGSLDWFRDQVASFGAVKAEQLMRESARKRATFEFGRMYLFKYDPKHKKTLPYYDTFPLIFPIGPRDNGFLGINLHYLPYQFRAKLMDALLAVTNNKKFDMTTKAVISYKILNKAAKFRFFRPCVKHYLSDHVQSQFVRIEASEWPIAIFLPVERFKKASTAKVWADSVQKFGGK